MPKPLRIGELADQSGISRDALRFYERRSLLPPAKRTAGGFRVYPPETFDRLRFIKQAQMVGLTLQEIAALVSHRTDSGLRRCRQVRDLLRKKVADVEGQLSELEVFRSRDGPHASSCGSLQPSPPCSSRFRITSAGSFTDTGASMTRVLALASLIALLMPTSGRAADPQHATTTAHPAATQTCTLKVSGMTCASCDVAVRLAAKTVSGVTAVNVDYPKAKAEVTYDPSKTNPQAIAAAITKVSGFKAEPVKAAQK